MEVDEVANGLEELDMDNYDEEDDEIEIFSSGHGDLYYASNEMDPYLNNNGHDDDDDSDDDQTILPTDSMIVCAKSDNASKYDNKANYLDLDDVLPCVQLGGKKRGRGSHTRSVLGLAWNKEFREILASASRDKKVKVWDVATETCKITMEHHTKKVQAVAWNHHSPEVLLSGSFDQTVVLKDGRNPSHSGFQMVSPVRCRKLSMGSS
ncbi:unnamed protein product [Arabis nemorensis]|uniref:Uncharacterized protein n=1 Tax=Arabis nemorensis TaxID=586526 RepID=A0A565CG92_9BRAS|nr:unnamed protein product [Arabis nemorensis]